MQKEVISHRQLICMMSLYIIGNSLVLGVNSTAKHDSWIAFLQAILFAIPLFLLYARIAQLHAGKTLFEFLPELFGKVLGWIIAALFTFYAISLGALIFRNFMDFMKAVFLLETPSEVILLIMLFVTLYMAKSGVETLGRWSVIVLYILCATVLMTIVFSLQNAVFSNLKPTLSTDYMVLFRSSMQSVSFPLGEVVLFLGIMSSAKKEDSKNKIFLWSLCVAGLVLLLALIRNLVVLGVPMMEDTYFPSYLTARLMNIGNFLNRLEGSISANFILAGIVKIVVCIIAASNGMTTLFGFQSNKNAIVPVGILMVTIAAVLYESLAEMVELISKVYLYYALPFQLVLPLLIWIVAEVKMRKKKQSGNQGHQDQRNVEKGAS